MPQEHRSSDTCPGAGATLEDACEVLAVLPVAYLNHWDLGSCLLVLFEFSISKHFIFPIGHVGIF